MWVLLVYWLISVCILSRLVRSETWRAEYGDKQADLGVWRPGFLLVAPLVSPLYVLSLIPCLVSFYFERRELIRFGQQHHDPEHTRLNFLYLDKSIRDWFERSTPDFFQMGFRLVGDFQYRTEPINLINRYFLSDDGTVVAALSAVDDERHSMGLQAITVDGVVVNATSLDSVIFQDLPGEQDQYRLAFLPDATPVEMRNAIHELADGAALLNFDPEQVGEFQQFCARRFSQWKHRLGKIAMPPEPVLPRPHETGELQISSMSTC